MNGLPLSPAPLVLVIWLPNLASALLASVWEGLLLTLAVAAALRLVPSLSAAAKSAVWTVVLLVLTMLPGLVLLMPSHAVGGGTGLHLELRISYMILSVWAGASAFRLVQLVQGALHLRRTLRRALPFPTTEAITAMLQVGSRDVQLCLSADVDRPSVAGFFRSRILLPTALAELGREELTHIILHEREHLRRRDDWFNLLQQLSLVLFPLNPALFWLSRRLSLERELACDDGVLRATRSRKAYAACLARIAENSLVRRGVSLALGVLGDWRRPEFTRRVERVLAAPQRPMGRLQLRFATGALIAGTLGGSALLAHSPELVSFVPATLNSSLAEGTRSTAWTPALAPLPGVGTPRMIPAKAILPATSPLRPALDLRKQLRRVHASRSHGRPRAAARVLLADWQATATATTARVVQTGPELHVVQSTSELRVVQSDSELRIVPVAIEGSRIWYTAIPYRDGWIVVQL